MRFSIHTNYRGLLLAYAIAMTLLTALALAVHEYMAMFAIIVSQFFVASMVAEGEIQVAKIKLRTGLLLYLIGLVIVLVRLGLAAANQDLRIHVVIVYIVTVAVYTIPHVQNYLEDKQKLPES